MRVVHHRDECDRGHEAFINPPCAAAHASRGSSFGTLRGPVSSGDVTIDRAGTHPGEQFCATIDIDLVYGTGVATSRRVHVSGAFSVVLQENAPTAPAK
jgi:hypothetical protein